MIDYLREKKELVSIALLVVSAIAAFVIVIKATDFFTAPAKAAEAVKDAIDQSKPDSKNLAAQLDKSKKLADGLKTTNLFSPPAPRKNPVTAVAGIMGDEALINGKLYKVGAKVGDAKIVAINPTSVTVEWDGKKKTFNPIDGTAGSGPSGPPRPGRPTASSRSSSSSGGRPGMVSVTQDPRRPGGGGPGGPSPMMGGMRGRMMNMSEADRNRMRERFENMSEAERDRFRQQMRERVGGRGGDRGGRGGPGGRR